MENIKHFWKKFKHKIKSSKQFLYLFICSLFIFSFISITFLGIKNKTDMNFDTVKLYQKQKLSDRTLLITKSLYNPTKELMRLDFYIDSSKEITSLNDKFTINMIAKNNQKQKIKGKVVRVSPNFYTVYFSGIKNNFKVVKSQLAYSFINNSSVDDTTDTNLEFYMNQKDIKTDNNLTLNKDKKVLLKDLVNVNIKLLNQKIDRKEDEIKQLKDKNITLNNQINSISEDIEYKIGSEKRDLLEQIDSIQRQIETNKTQIIKLNKLIEMQKERISLEKKKLKNEK